MNATKGSIFFFWILCVQFFALSGLQAQAPQKMSYQAVIRDAANNLVVNRPVGMRFTVIRGSAAGTTVYAETHRSTTNINGMVSLEIGAGTPLFNTFAGINWATGPYFLKTETDPNGGTAYTISGTSQLLSVPYALYAEKAGNAGVNGFSTLVRTTAILPNGSRNCPDGGVKLDYGLDTNRNNVLDNAEINATLTRFVCNGKPGISIIRTVDNNNGTFTFFYSDGTTFTTSNLTGPAGRDGLTIVSTIDNGNGTFTINYNDGSSFTSSDLTGPTGVTGQTGAVGPQGIQGPQGLPGLNGANGVGITSTVNNGNGTYTFNYSDGSSFTTADLTGPQGLQGIQGQAGATGIQGPIGLTGATGQTGAVGPQGIQGPQGLPGQNGNDGVSITNSFVQGDSLFVQLSNGQTLNTGYVRGPVGPQGLPGSSASLPSGLNNETLRNNNGNWQSDNFLVNNGQQIGVGTTTPNSSALMELSSNNKGFLPPRLTTAERNAISNPAIGLVIYNTTQNCLNYYGVNSWYELCGNCTPPAPLAPASISGNNNQCQNNTSQIYSVSSVQNANTYNWSVPAGWTIVSGTGTNQITVNIGSNAQSGNVSVNAANGCGASTATTLSVTVSSIPNIPFSATHTATSSQITWNWLAVSGATGYYVNTTNNFATAQFVSGTSYVQSGLICNTMYSLFVWANNSCGASNPVQLTQSTSGCCQIGTTNYGGVIAILNNTNPCTGVAATVNSAPNTYTFSDAVSYCDNLVEGGFSDWYLPTYAQLTSMYSNKVAIGNFLNAIYWSPSHTGDGRYWTVNFQNGQAYGYDASPMYIYRVRCVRNF